MRNKGSAGSLTAVIVIGLLVFTLVLGLALFGWYKAGYNKAVRLDEGVEAAWGEVENLLQRRSNMLTSLLPNLLALREAYPDLKSNQNFLALQDQLEGSENRISVARTRYNEAAKALNTYARELFGAWFCKKVGVEEKPYFEATQQAQTEVPTVDFSTPQPEPAPQ